MFKSGQRCMKCKGTPKYTYETKEQFTDFLSKFNLDKGLFFEKEMLL
jgi:hypothetical protein